jgi:hypothetical protein
MNCESHPLFFYLSFQLGGGSTSGKVDLVVSGVLLDCCWLT